ncbi:hypothetical protein TIFTF001_032514 [Ficus carica]|uniref:Uncharacterized protein n=1 Tax=Ficus carica TaxID=3494 RepID=A0AA88DXL7_FICCA|nr:hypothetical protein TIFTF001_032514 [Ficus carica]
MFANDAQYSYNLLAAGLSAPMEISLSSSSSSLYSDEEGEVRIKDDWKELDNQYVFYLVSYDVKKVFIQCFAHDDKLLLFLSNFLSYFNSIPTQRRSGGRYAPEQNVGLAAERNRF